MCVCVWVGDQCLGWHNPVCCILLVWSTPSFSHVSLRFVPVCHRVCPSHASRIKGTKASLSAKLWKPFHPSPDGDSPDGANATRMLPRLLIVTWWTNEKYEKYEKYEKMTLEFIIGEFLGCICVRKESEKPTVRQQKHPGTWCTECLLGASACSDAMASNPSASSWFVL